MRGRVGWGRGGNVAPAAEKGTNWFGTVNGLDKALPCRWVRRNALRYVSSLVLLLLSY